MDLVVTSTAQEMALWGAQYIKQAIHLFSPSKDRPFLLGLPTGATPLGVYRELISFYEKGELSFEHVITFNMDEYVGLAHSDPQSYHYYMWENFFNHIDIDPENVHIPRGLVEHGEKTLAESARDYEALIDRLGPITLFVSGIGRNGHLAFNEPGSPFDSMTRVVDLSEDTREANSMFFGNHKSVPHQAVSVGLQTIFKAKEILLLSSGSAKKEVITRILNPEAPHISFPASILKLHPHVRIVCDEASSPILEKKTEIL